MDLISIIVLGLIFLIIKGVNDNQNNDNNSPRTPSGGYREGNPFNKHDYQH